MKALTRLALLAVATVLTACGTDTYDTGDGALSGMMADFVEAQTDAYANMVSIETDDGERLELTTPVAMEWASRPDTVYRALFYYSLADGNDGQAEADPMAVQQVLVPEITPADDIADGVKTDPVALETAWLSSNGRYINLGVIIKTGTRLRLYHDQAGVPEYYSADAYVSIAVSRLPGQPTEGDTVSINVETYDGTVTRTFTL